VKDRKALITSATIPEYRYVLVFLFPRRIVERIGLNEKKE
jgi:hypothetical protein